MVKTLSARASSSLRGPGPTSTHASPAAAAVPRGDEPEVEIGLLLPRSPGKSPKTLWQSQGNARKPISLPGVCNASDPPRPLCKQELISLPNTLLNCWSAAAFIPVSSREHGGAEVAPSYLTAGFARGPAHLPVSARCKPGLTLISGILA